MGTNYKVVKNGNVFEVVENSSTLTIKKFSKHREAKALMLHMEKGHGFAGMTPPFFLQKIKLQK